MHMHEHVCLRALAKRKDRKYILKPSRFCKEQGSSCCRVRTLIFKVCCKTLTWILPFAYGYSAAQVSFAQGRFYRDTSEDEGSGRNMVETFSYYTS